MRKPTTGLLLAALLFASPVALGQPSTPSVLSDAAELKRNGDLAIEQKRYQDALDAYEAAYAQVPSPALLYNRGRALQFLARYAQALDMIEQFAQTAPAELQERVKGLPELLTDLRSKVSTLVIHCDTSGARVLVGQRQVGVTPLATPLRVNAGKQTIDIFADGFFAYHRDALLPGGAELTLDVALTSRDRSGLLIIKSAMTGVAVKVDAKSVGQTPTEVGAVAGPHRVDVDKEGYGTASTQVMLQAGERKELSLDPLARPALYTRWWFWTGVAVLAAGVATTIIVLTTEKAAPNGEFSPGRVAF